ncbi:MAG: hypothetical protein M1282_11575 [Chloroflexi bacterium]|nr:hypothetical protein [Chloroflexota bacterium]
MEYPAARKRTKLKTAATCADGGSRLWRLSNVCKRIFLNHIIAHIPNGPNGVILFRLQGSYYIKQKGSRIFSRQKAVLHVKFAFAVQ